MRLALLAILLLAMPLATMAQPATDNDDPLLQRQLFRTLFRQAQRGHLTADSTQLEALQGYPLRDYVMAAILRQQIKTRPSRTLDHRIAAFIDAHPNLPPAHRLRRSWLASLGKRHRWTLLIEHTHDDDGTTAQCRRVVARIELDQHPEDAALALWRVGHSQPSACDPVFAWLDRQGLLTTQEILHRARLSYAAGQYGMVRYLARKLPDQAAAKTDRWLRVASHPQELATHGGLPETIVVHAFKRYALRDWDDAAKLYARVIRKQQPGPQARYDMARYVALLLAEDHNPDALQWFARLDDQRMDDHARAWYVRSALWNRRWSTVIQTIRAMPASQRHEESWRYWLGRALQEIGKTDKAQQILGKLAGQRSYYGYLAADRLDRSYSFNDHPLPDNPQARAHVLSLPALSRARELHALGLTWRFRSEWNTLMNGLDQAQLRAAASIASQHGWHSRAIVALARGDYWDALDIRYPTPWLTTVRQVAQSTHMAPAYVLAIMRTESLFQPSVVSSAGAIGLMQLMPGTAQRVARSNNLPGPSRNDLLDPPTNIRLGTHYLHAMLARFNGNYALATAAYNAGPKAVERWLPDHDNVPPDIWVANIAYTETRRYVRHVMAHMTVFQHRLAGHAERLNQRITLVTTDYDEAPT